MFKRILDKDTSTIAKSLLMMIIGINLLKHNNTLAISLGLTSIFLSVYHLFIGNIKSPVLLIVTLFILLALNTQGYTTVTKSPANIDFTLPSSLSVYFATLSMSYLISTKDKGNFLLALVNSSIFTISMLILDGNSNIRIYGFIIITTLMLITSISLLYFKKKSKKGETL